jgi:glycosyltransferase involved in cell wall biosynthesis
VKILMFVDSLRSGGKERRLIELLKGLRGSESINTEIVLMSKEIAYKDFYTLDIPTHYLIRSTKKDFKIFPSLYSLCKRIKPDIIHVWDTMTAIYAIPICKLLGIKLVNSMITDAPNVKTFSRKWVRSKIASPFSDLILANSEAGLEAYNAPRDRSACIHNGFDWNRLNILHDPLEIRSRFGITTEKIVIMVASFSPFKDYESYISMAKEIVDKRQDVTFIAVGDGILYSGYKAGINGRYPERIKLVGRQADVESIVNAATIGVLLTNGSEHGEGISNSIMEYMALGKPVVASDSGGTREIVADGETGYIVHDKHTESIRTRIEYLLDNPSVAQALGRKGSERIKDEFSLERMVNLFSEQYAKLLPR